VELINADKIVHMGVFGLLALLCYISLIHQRKFSILRNKPLVFTVLICSLYGLTDEFHQYFVPNRDSEIWDWYSDVAGVIITVLIVKFYLSRKYKLFSNKQLHSVQE
jgi:VanZ family protein